MQTSFPPPLTPAEEQEYFQKLCNGDCTVRDILVERNLRLVAHIAKKYFGAETDMEDLISIGTIGLIKAVDTYDPQKQNRFASYASRCVENELLMFFRKKKKTCKDISLYEPISMDKEGNQVTLEDLAPSQERSVWETVIFDKDVQKLYELLPEVLEEREQSVLICRYGLYNTRPQTQREIAARMGISRSYVSRIEKRALEKLKRAFS